MPSTLTYPGVYIEEIPSGVRTITGVSTSVAAFVGPAKRGPINKAVRLLSFADYERRFGGLGKDLELSYAVRQFFLNGGSEAWVVRVARGAVHASRVLLNLPAGVAAPQPVLRLTAREAGALGREIAVEVDYDTDNPGSTFNLRLSLVPRDDPAGAVFEQFTNLSMREGDPRFVEAVVEAQSRLVAAKLNIVAPATMPDIDDEHGFSRSGDLTHLDLGTAVDATHNTLRLAIDGAEPVTVIVNEPAPANLAALATVVQEGIDTQLGTPRRATVAAGPSGSPPSLVITSSATGPTSSVRVLPAPSNDLAARLKLGPLFGGQEQDAVAVWRPATIPNPAELIGGSLDATVVGDEIFTRTSRLTLILDGQSAEITLVGGSAPASNEITRRLEVLAERLEQAVRNERPANPAFSGSTATVDSRIGPPATDRLVLRSGTRGAGSSIEVRPAGADALATLLRLTSSSEANLTGARSSDLFLEGGSEQPFPPDYYNLFIGNRDQREGIFALEDVDLFNLLVLPGIDEPGVLADAAAYCVERRAFLIADAPRDLRDPSAMENAARGTALPKSRNGAVYYPWIRIADPLQEGRLRDTAPGGAVAGLFARTDSTRGVWKAPAGTDATLVGVQALAYPLTDRETGILNPRGVNCLRIFPVFGALAWGARTLVGDDQQANEWKYIPVRRLALFIEESLYRGTKWAVFEPNDEPLWAQLRLNIGAFMQNLFRQGAFQGKSPREAYFVKCDSETTTQTDVNQGIVNIMVGFAPLKPAEFVVIKLQQMAGQIET
jgi:hypothetical protein